jgi:predicted DNA-binding protein with PD1-like motif
MQFFRGGTAAELIPFHLADDEDLVPTLARMAEELNLGTAAVAMGSGALSVARMLAAGAPGPAPLGVIIEHEGPLAVISLQGWILANQPELHLTLSRGAAVIAGRATQGCLVRGGVEGLLLRLGNLRISRVSDPQIGSWSLSATARPQELPTLTLQGRPVDFHAVLKVPRILLERYIVLPIAITGNTLLVATADPRNLFAQDDLRLATGMRVQWIETPRPALEAALNEVLRHLQ